MKRKLPALTLIFLILFGSFPQVSYAVTDTTQLFDLVAQLEALPDGGTLLLPEVVSVDRTIMVEKDVTLIGQGVDQTTMVREGGNEEPLFWVRGEGRLQLDQLTLDTEHADLTKPLLTATSGGTIRLREEVCFTTDLHNINQIAWVDGDSAVQWVKQPTYTTPTVPSFYSAAGAQQYSSGETIGIYLQSYPLKQQYVEGDSFDPTGMVVMAIDAFGQSHVVDDYKVTPETMTADTQVVTISYEGQEATIYITVKQRPTVSLFEVTLPDNLQYDGTAKVVTMIPKQTVSGVGRVTVWYQADDGMETTTPPTDAGGYRVLFSTEGGNQYGAVTTPTFVTTMTITKAPIQLTVSPIKEVLVGTTTTMEVTVTPPTTRLSYDLPTQDFLSVDEVGNLTGHRVTAEPILVTVGAVGGDNFQSTTATVFVSVVPKPVALVTLGVADAVVYDGDARSLGTQFVASATDDHGMPLRNGSFTYRYQGKDYTYEELKQLTVVNAGDYTVTALYESDTHQGQATQTFTVDKAKAKDFSINPMTALVFGEAYLLTTTDATGAVTFAVVEGEAVGRIEGNLLTTIGVGQLTIRATTQAEENYQSGEETLQLTVDKATPQNFSLDVVSTLSYGSQTTLKTIGGQGDGAVVYTVQSGDGITINGSVATATDVGVVTLQAVKEADDHYQQAVAVAQVQVTPKQLQLTPPTVLDKVYDGTDQAVLDLSTVQLLGVVGEDDVTLGTITQQAKFRQLALGIQPVEVVWQATLTGADQARYHLAEETLQLTGRLLPIPSGEGVIQGNPAVAVSVTPFENGSFAGQSDAIQRYYTDVDGVYNALSTALGQVRQVVVLDVSLDQPIKGSPFTLLLPFPTGRTATDEVVIAHIRSSDGVLEFPPFTVIEGVGFALQLTDASPLAIGYRTAEVDTLTQATQTPIQTTGQTGYTGNDGSTVLTAPKTGDDTRIVWYGLAFGVSFVLIGILWWEKKKK